MTILILVGVGAALVGAFAGAALGAWLTDKRLRARFEDVGAEIVRLRAIAEDKLAGDDPDLPTLLRNLNTAVEQTYRAVDALEHQAAVTRRKSEGGKEILASSKEVIRMLEELGAGVTGKTQTLSLTPPVSFDDADETPAKTD